MEPTTPKGHETRARILEAATRLFERRGYPDTTLRAIAEEAGVSPGLAYRYFESKDALVLALYARLSDAFAERVASLPEGSWSARSLVALDTSLEVLAPYREVLAALLGPMTSRSSAIYAPLAAGEARVREGFVRAVAGAADPPADPEQLGEMLYLGHLAVLLFWLIDRSEGQQATAQLRAWGGSLLPWLGTLLALPLVRPQLQSLVHIVRLGILGRSP